MSSYENIFVIFKFQIYNIKLLIFVINILYCIEKIKFKFGIQIIFMMRIRIEEGDQQLFLSKKFQLIIFLVFNGEMLCVLVEKKINFRIDNNVGYEELYSYYCIECGKIDENRQKDEKVSKRFIQVKIFIVLFFLIRCRRVLDIYMGDIYIKLGLNLDFYF